MPEKGLLNIALISPNKNAYSETFIQAHKEHLKGNIFYYYGSGFPSKLEGQGVLQNSRYQRILHILKGRFNKNKFSLEQLTFIKSLELNKIDVVLAESGVLGMKLVYTCDLLNLPLIVHFHGKDASSRSLIEANKSYKKIFDYATYIIGVSKKMCRDLLEMGCPPEKLKYNVYGPNEKFLEVNPKFSRKQFVAIGRFVDKKAPYYLILSFLKVIKQFPETKLIIAGEGKLLNTCKNLVAFYGLKHAVVFPGVISPERFRVYLKESMAFIQHSITAEDGDSEGTPVAVLEASAAGLPIISTFHAGIPDVIINNKTGLLTQEHDVGGMTKNMIYLLEEPEIAKNMGIAGKENIQNNFTLQRHISIIDELIAAAFYNN